MCSTAELTALYYLDASGYPVFLGRLRLLFCLDASGYPVFLGRLGLPGTTDAEEFAGGLNSGRWKVERRRLRVQKPAFYSIYQCLKP